MHTTYHLNRALPFKSEQDAADFILLNSVITSYTLDTFRHEQGAAIVCFNGDFLVGFWGDEEQLEIPPSHNITSDVVFNESQATA